MTRLWLGLGLGAALSAGCGGEPFRCSSDVQCVTSTMRGLCQASGYCSFPDLNCASGQRYGGFAGDGLAGTCVPAAGTDPVASTLGTTSTFVSSSSTTPEPSTTIADSTGSPAPRSCADVPAGMPSGTYRVSDPRGDEYDVHCEMGLAGGGWTLVAVSSDDGTTTWTYVNRDLFVDRRQVGRLDAINLDFKSQAMALVPFNSVLFVHLPSLVWASYANVGDGQQTLADFIAGIPLEICGGQLEWSYPLSDGTIADTPGTLCDMRLYFNRDDLEGTKPGCDEPRMAGMIGATFGPCFNADRNDGCPFDDPPTAGFGPQSSAPDFESNGNGFGVALALNNGEPGAGENAIQMFVR